MVIFIINIIFWFLNLSKTAKVKNVYSVIEVCKYKQLLLTVSILDIDMFNPTE